MAEGNFRENGVRISEALLQGSSAANAAMVGGSVQFVCEGANPLLLARARGGAEIVIEGDALTVAVLHTATPPRRSNEECIALLPEDSTATIDEDFARDVEEAVAAHREPLNPPAWN